MTERETDDRERGENPGPCPTCATVNRATDRFCAQCGAPLPVRATVQNQAIASPTAPGAVPDPPGADVSTRDAAPADGSIDKEPDQENAAWLLGARPATVIAGGLLFLLLAAALLAIGQRDSTGTLVMLAICTAPLALLTLAIGISRSIAAASRRGR